jgi:hypothetical protein
MWRARAPEPAGGTIDAGPRATRRGLLIGAAAAAGALLAGRTGPAASPSTAATPARSRLLLPLAGGRPPAPPAAVLPGGITIVPLGPTATPTARPVSAATSPVGPPATPIALAPPERAPILRGSKWGIGVYREGNTIFDDLYASRPGVILLMDPSEGWARRIRSTFPSAFVVGRRYLSEAAQPLDSPEARGAALADWVAELGRRLGGIVNAWMSYNEVTSHDDRQGYRLYNRLQVAFARRLQGVHGLSAVAGNDGSGTVEPADYPTYFGEAIRASHYFGVHAYSPLGSRSMREGAEWHALRYRMIHEALDRAGIGGVQTVVTESGLGDGWRGRVDEAAMADDFAWFTEELEKDPYMIGHASFGVFGNDDRWRSFDLRGTDLLARLGRR